MAYDESWDFSDVEEVGVDAAEYKPTSQFPPPPPMGRYEVKGVPDRFILGNKGGGNVFVKSAQVEILDDEFKGRKASAFISAFPRSYGDPGSDMDDFLRAGGVYPKGSKFTVQEIGEGVNNTWESTRKVEIGWDGYCRTCGKTTLRNKGTEKYPGFADPETGDVFPAKACPECGSTVAARAYVRKWFVI